MFVLTHCIIEGDDQGENQERFHDERIQGRPMVKGLQWQPYIDHLSFILTLTS